MRLAFVVVVSAVLSLAACTNEAPSESIEISDEEAAALEGELAPTRADGYPARPTAEETALQAVVATYRARKEEATQLRLSRATAQSALEIAEAGIARVEAGIGGEKSESAEPPAFLDAGARADIDARLVAFYTVERGADGCDRDAHLAVLQAVQDALAKGQPSGDVFGDEMRRVEAVAGGVDAYDAINQCLGLLKPFGVQQILDGWVGRTCALVAEDLHPTAPEADRYEAYAPAEAIAAIDTQCALARRAGVSTGESAGEVQQFHRWIAARMDLHADAARKARRDAFRADADGARAEVAAADARLAELDAELAVLKPQRDRYVVLHEQREAAIVEMQVAAMQARADAENAARAEREEAWRAAGNVGLSPEGTRECERNTMLYSTVSQVAAAKSQFEGASNAVDWAVAELRRKGLSDECIAHLSS